VALAFKTPSSLVQHWDHAKDYALDSNGVFAHAGCRSMTASVVMAKVTGCQAYTFMNSMDTYFHW
jgi:hypothetical protein